MAVCAYIYGHSHKKRKENLIPFCFLWLYYDIPGGDAKRKSENLD